MNEEVAGVSPQRKALVGLWIDCPKLDESHAIPGGRWVKAIAHIRNNSTGEVRKRETDEILMDGESHPSVFNWEFNNFSCDCNREIFFERAGGKEIESECSRGRFSVNLENPKTCKLYYREFVQTEEKASPAQEGEKT